VPYTPAATLRTRDVGRAGRRCAVVARTDQPGHLVDSELRLLFRALESPPPPPLIELPSWDAGLAMRAAQEWHATGRLTALHLGAAHSCINGLSSDASWEVDTADRPPQIMAQSAVVRMPFWLGRAGAEWCLWRAAERLVPHGRLYLVGARDRGVDGLRAVAEPVVGPLLSSAVGEHRRLYVYERTVSEPPPQDFPGTMDTAVAGQALRVHLHPLVFSPETVDFATEALAECLPPRGGRWLDLGCGSGVIATLAARRRDRQVTACDWSYAAAETTRATLDANGVGAQVVLADGVPEGADPFDVITLYPPFHVGHRVDHTPSERLLEAARAALAPRGEVVVALTSAQSEARLLRGRFRHVEVLLSAKSVRVFSCR